MNEGSNDKNWWNKWRIKSNFCSFFSLFLFLSMLFFRYLRMMVYFVTPISRVNNFRSISFSAEVFRSYLTRIKCQVHYGNVMHVTQTVTAPIMAFWSKVIQVTSTFTPDNQLVRKFIWKYSILRWNWNIFYLPLFVIQHISPSPERFVSSQTSSFFFGFPIVAPFFCDQSINNILFRPNQFYDSICRKSSFWNWPIVVIELFFYFLRRALWMIVSVGKYRYGHFSIRIIAFI